MHLIFPPATITLIFASTIKAAAGTDENQVRLKSLIAGDVNDAYSTKSTGLRTPASIGDECMPPATLDTNAIRSVETKPDVGVMTQCHPLGQVCVPDGSSSLGGHCRSKASISTRKAQTPRRHLLENPFVCPSTCPEDLCACANSTELGYPDAQDCAPEINDVCTSGDTPKCFGADSLEFYEQTYCAFATCWLDGNRYEDCACGYYQNYCNLYGDYVDSYPEIADKCAVAACCDQANDGDEKIMCVPAMMPSAQPSTNPTATAVPSTSPSNEPTGSPTRAPSGSPTKDPNPPTNAPSGSPMKEPTESPVANDPPTTSPNDPPTTSPSENPANAPTESPTEMPTQDPTSAPTEVPTKVTTNTPSDFPTKEPTNASTNVPVSTVTSAPTPDVTRKEPNKIGQTQTSTESSQSSDPETSLSVTTGSSSSVREDPSDTQPASESNTYLQNCSSQAKVMLSVGVGVFWLFT